MYVQRTAAVQLVFFFFLLTMYIYRLCLSRYPLCSVQSYILPTYEFSRIFQFIDGYCKSSISSDVILHSYLFCVGLHLNAYAVVLYPNVFLASSVNLFILINYSAYVLRYYWTIVAILLFIYGCLGANILWVPTFSCIRLHLNFAGIHLTALRPSFCCSQNIFLLVYLNIFLIFLLIDVVISQIRLLITKSVALSK